MKKILAVDDEADILKVISVSLADDYEVFTTTDSSLVIELLQKHHPDIVLLDVNMPGMNGYEICSAIRAIKEFEDLPMIFITGQSESFVRMTCYQVGGDNFLTKPFHVGELKAIIERHTKKQTHKTTSYITYGDIVLNPLSHQILVGGLEIELAPKEFQILLYMIQHPEVVVSREVLLSKIWKDSLKVTDRTVDTHISNLRRKLAVSACQIKSVYRSRQFFCVNS